ncbi:MAG: hypothetical protein RL139_1558 [Gemmatimonadota bacterium]|jgi:hypothetical protein
MCYPLTDDEITAIAVRHLPLGARLSEVEDAIRDALALAELRPALRKLPAPRRQMPPAPAPAGLVGLSLGEIGRIAGAPAELSPRSEAGPHAPASSEGSPANGTGR